MDRNNKKRRSSILKVPFSQCTEGSQNVPDNALNDATQNFAGPSQNQTDVYRRRVSFSHRVVQKIDIDEEGREHCKTPMEELLQTTASSDGLFNKPEGSMLASTFISNAQPSFTADKTINLFKNLEMAMDQTQNKTVDIFKNLADTFDQTQSTMTAQLFQNLEATNNGNITMNQNATKTERTANLFAKLLVNNELDDQHDQQMEVAEDQTLSEESFMARDFNTTFMDKANAISIQRLSQESDRTPLCRRSTSFFRNAEPIYESSMSFSIFNKTDDSNSFMGDQVEPESAEEMTEVSNGREEAEKSTYNVEAEKSTLLMKEQEPPSLEIVSESTPFKNEDATYTVAKEVKEVPVKAVQNLTEEFTIINDYETLTPLNEGAAMGQTFVVDKSVEQKQVIFSQETTQDDDSFRLTESLLNTPPTENTNDSKSRCEEQVRKFRDNIRRSIDEIRNSPKLSMSPEPRPISSTGVLNQSTPQPLLELSETRNDLTFNKRSILEEIEESEFDDEQFKAEAEELKKSMEHSTGLLECVQTPEALISQLHLTQTLNASGFNRNTGLLAPIPTGQGNSAGLLAPILTGQSGRYSRSANRKSMQQLGTTMEVSENMETETPIRDLNMFDSRFDPNDFDLKMDETNNQSTQAPNAVQAAQDLEENMSLIADTRPNPMAMMTSIGAPTEINFTSLQEPEELESTSSTFGPSYQMNMSKPALPFTLGETLLEEQLKYEPSQSSVEPIQEENLEDEVQVENESETETSINARREFTAQIEKIMPELRELLKDFEEIDSEAYKKILFLGSNKIDKDDLQVMEAFESLAFARVLYIMTKSSASASLKDPKKSVKIALYSILQGLVAKKRNLVESIAPKVPELLRSTHKEYRSREKKLEKYLKMLPEEREIHDKREEAICFAKCALVNALRNTVQIFLDKEENEKKEDKEKNKKYLQLAMKYLPSSGV